MVFGGIRCGELTIEKMDARELLEGLLGQTIPTMTGRQNRILRLDANDVIVATGKSPEGKRVPIDEVQDALDRLVRDREIEITVPSVGYRSAFIGAVLSTVPGTIGTTNPRMIRLRRTLT